MEIDANENPVTTGAPGNPAVLNGNPATQAQAQAQAPVGANTDSGLAAAVAALTAALKPQGDNNDHSPVDAGSTGDIVLDSMVSSVQLAYPKLDIDRAVGKAIETGDARFIDEAYLREKTGDKFSQVLKIAQAAVERVTERSTSIQNSVFDTVGGKANWDTAVAGFNKEAPQALREAVATMLDSTKAEYIKAAAEMVREFAASRGMLKTTTAPGGRPTFSSAPGGNGLSKEAFRAELAKIDLRARDYPQKLEELRQQRAVGARLGL